MPALDADDVAPPLTGRVRTDDDLLVMDGIDRLNVAKSYEFSAFVKLPLLTTFGVIGC